MAGAWQVSGPWLCRRESVVRQADRVRARQNGMERKVSTAGVDRRARRVGSLAARVRRELARRDSVIRSTEREAGRLLVEMVEGEGLTVREAVASCGECLSMREASRLRGLAKAGT